MPWLEEFKETRKSCKWEILNYIHSNLQYTVNSRFITIKMDFGDKYIRIHLSSVSCKVWPLPCCSWGLPQTSGPQRASRQRSVEESPVTSPQTPDNPWTSRLPSPGALGVSFSDIVQDEIQKHESLAQVTSKPLALVQVSCTTPVLPV